LLPLDETPSRAAEQSRCALVLTVATATADGLMKLDDGHFLTAIQDRFGYRLGRLQRVGKRYCYPLQLRCIKDQVRPGVVVIGNAAHRLHPVAGQGFNLALRGVADLATVIAEACAQRQPLNGSSLLQTYQQLRAADQRRTVALSDYLIRLFANNGRLLSRARSLGLIALDTLPFAKKLFAQQAMGFAPSMPPAPGRR